MENYKIVITGNYAAGKTQLIRSVSEIDIVDTEVPVYNSEELLVKNHTTVGLDFGTITIDSERKLYLFGTPGQERFDFMWDVLAEGCLGYIVMVDSCKPAQLEATAKLINHFAHLTTAPFIVAANKQDDVTALPPLYIHRRLRLPDDIPVVPCVATNPESARDVLLCLLDSALESEVSSPM